MTADDNVSGALEIDAYRGRGTRGWRIPPNTQAEHELPQELVTVDAGCAFGGEWERAQEWQILEGTGWLRWDEPFASVRIAPGDRYCIGAGERRLVVAASALKIRITVIDDPALPAAETH